MTSNGDNSATNPDSEEDSTGILDDIVPPISKTPLYEAMHAARYQRQALIREIQQVTDSQLICYVGGITAPVDREDVRFFVDLLHNISPGQNIDLLLHTIGGDIDAAEKLITMVRKKAGTSRLRVIVPDYAKSAGTLMALGADRIIMSDTSELGPIDPQVIRTDRNGNRMMHSVKNYLDAYDVYEAALKHNPKDVTAGLMMSKLDPETVRLFRSVLRRAQELAGNLLKRGMMHNGGAWTQTVSMLLDTTRFQTHSQPITWEDALSPAIGLTVDYLGPKDELWLKLWQLYCLQSLAIKDAQKLFESEIASICTDSPVV